MRRPGTVPLGAVHDTVEVGVEGRRHHPHVPLAPKVR